MALVKGTPGLSRINSFSQTTSSAGIAGCGFMGLPGKIDYLNYFYIGKKSLNMKKFKNPNRHQQNTQKVFVMT